MEVLWLAGELGCWMWWLWPVLLPLAAVVFAIAIIVTLAKKERKKQ